MSLQAAETLLRPLKTSDSIVPETGSHPPDHSPTETALSKPSAWSCLGTHRVGGQLQDHDPKKKDQEEAGTMSYALQTYHSVAIRACICSLDITLTDFFPLFSIYRLASRYKVIQTSRTGYVQTLYGLRSYVWALMHNGFHNSKTSPGL